MAEKWKKQISDEELTKKMKEHIDECDVYEFQKIAAFMFGGTFEHMKKPFGENFDMYVLTENDQYGNAFGEPGEGEGWY